MPKLVINSGTPSAVEFELKPGVNRLGRGPANDFRVEEPSVSSAHAEILVETGSVTVKDLRSTNGTFVNRSQIREAFLQPGQILSLGGVEMLFEADVPVAATSQGGVARTIALPQVGGIKITRPGMAPVAGGHQMPGNYPAPMAPAPNLSTAPTPLKPVPQTQVQAQPQYQLSPLTEPGEDRTWKSVPAARSTPASGMRCLGFGLGAAILSGAIWISVAALARINPAPVALVLTGVVCGLSLRLASRNRAGIPFSLLAAGCALLGMFIGESGQVFAIQQISFADYNLALIVAGLVCAAVIGGMEFSGKSARHTEFA